MKKLLLGILLICMIGGSAAACSHKTPKADSGNPVESSALVVSSFVSESEEPLISNDQDTASNTFSAVSAGNKPSQGGATETSSSTGSAAASQESTVSQEAQAGASSSHSESSQIWSGWV